MRSDRVSRRRMLGTLGALGIGGLAGCTGDGDGDGGDATDSPDDMATPTETSGDGMTGTATEGGSMASGTVRIGALQPLSGDLQYYGQQSMWGLYAGFGHKADAGAAALPEATTGTKTMTVGDVDYELLVRDTELNPDRAQQVATTLVSEDDVDLLFGCTLSSSAAQVVQAVTKQAGVPTVLGPAASAGLTSNAETCGENVFRASENVAMDARSGGKYVADNTDISKVYLFGADYSFGRSVVENYRTVLEANGVEIVGEKFVPRGYKEWDGLLDNAESAGAEGIVAGFTVQTLPALFTSFLGGDYSYRVVGGLATQITNSIVGNTLKKALGEPLTEEKLANSQLGPFTTRYHWNQYDNPINDDFVATYTEAYGVVPDLFTSGTFTAASSIVQAVQAAGSTAPPDVAAALRGMTVAETPKGEDGYTYQSYDNQARSAMTVADLVPTTAENWPPAIQPSEPLATVSAGETTVPADADSMNCSL